MLILPLDKGHFITDIKASTESTPENAPENNEPTTISIGDKVVVTRTVQQDGKTKGYQYAGGMFTCYYSTYDVISVKGDRVVIGIGSTVTAAVNISDLAKA